MEAGVSAVGVSVSDVGVVEVDEPVVLEALVDGLDVSEALVGVLDAVEVLDADALGTDALETVGEDAVFVDEICAVEAVVPAPVTPLELDGDDVAGTLDLVVAGALAFFPPRIVSPPVEPPEMAVPLTVS